MPLFYNDFYRPPLLLRNGHTNTLYTYYKGQRLTSIYQRSRMNTPDGDFVDIDTMQNGQSRAILLLHGLEGSAKSQYIINTAMHYCALGYDIIALNHRSCGGEINRTTTMYHSGFTIDVHTVLSHYSLLYDNIFIIGFSMGGNMALKYNGEGLHLIPSNLIGIAAVSVPIELKGSSHEISKVKNTIYEREFLKTLLYKARLKQAQFPSIIDEEAIDKIDSLLAFDDHFTGPLHGFEDGNDYYAKASSRQFLTTQHSPSILITSLDDPFLSQSCYPVEEAQQSSNFYLHLTKYGGHVGYYDHPTPYYLKVIDRFLEEIIY